MAGRVNTKFVITLSAVLVLVFGGLLGAALWIKLHNAPDLIRKGDARMEAGKALLAAGKSAEAQAEFEAAEKLYSKAVYKEQMNADYVQKWVDSLRAWVPESQSRAQDAFRQRLVPSLRQVAIARKNDVKAHREYLDLLYRGNRSAPSRAGAEALISDVDRTLLYFRGDPKENGEAQVLRRYRGLIVTSMMASRGMELTTEQMDQALADLEAAYKADPTDSESGVAVMSWYDARARMARTNNKTELADELDAKARESIEGFAKAHPDDTLGALRSLYMKVYLGQKSIKEGQMKSREAYEAGRALAKSLEPDFKHACELVKARGGDLTSDELGALQELDVFFNPEGGFAITQQALRTLIEKHPDRPEAYHALATIMSDRDSIPEAMSLLQKIVDMPPLPVGMEGLSLYGLKSQALYLQAVYSFQQWETENAKDPQGEAAKALLAASKKYRADMAVYTGSDSEQLRFVDGLHKFAEGDWLGAKVLLAEYIRRYPGQNIKADWTLAQCELRLRNSGAALEMLNRIVSIRPDIPGPVVQRAALLNDLGRTSEAVAALEDFLSVNPDNPPAKDLLTRIQIASGTAKATDPVEASIIEARRFMQGSESEPPDPEAAVTRLEKAIQENPDPRLHLMLASLRLDQGDQKAAIAVLETGRAAYPDNKDIAIFLEGVKSDDPVAWRVKQIDEQKDASEVERLLAKYTLWSTAAAGVAGTNQASRGPAWTAEANAALDKAAELAPDDQRVVDRVFTVAITAKDWARAEKMVEKAAAKDFDRAGGAMYKGRLLYARGQAVEAATVLREAADKGIADVMSLRLLAIIYQQLGRADDAETYFKEAIKLRPSDAPTQVMYLTVLQQSGRTAEALAKAKEAEPACRTSQEFMNLLLNLEGAAGKPEDALARRKAIHDKDPRNVGNTLALAGLYIDAKQWKDAQDVLTELRKIGDGSDLALAEARLYAEQGDYAKSQQAMDDFIKRQDPKALKWDTFVAFGRFLIDRKQYPEGIAMMRRGEDFQDPKVMEADRAVGEALIEIGQPDVAVVVLKAIVDAGADGPRQEVRIRLAELCAGQGASLATQGNAEASRAMFQQANELLQQVKPPAEIAIQTQVMLGRAEVARGLKDDKKATELFNQAVAQFPTDPMVYFRRAQFQLARGQAGAPDALLDLDAAIRVRPSFWQARRLRSFVYFGMGGDENIKKAIDEVKETLRINPSLDDLRIQLLNELITRDLASEASEVADGAAKARPNDIPLVMNMGQAFAQAGEWARAADYFRLGWQRSARKRPDIAQTLLNAVLNVPNPNLNEADEILRDVQKLGQVDASGKKVDAVLTNSGLLLARAKLLMKRGRANDAIKDIMVSMTAITVKPPTADEIGTWAQEVRRMFPKPEDELEILTRKDVPAPFYEWSLYLRGSLLSESPATRAQAGTVLNDLLAKSKTPDVRRLSYRVLGTTEFLQGRYDVAEAMWRKGAAEFPDDWELNNNLAYVLARHLNRSKDALPFAESAAKGAKAIPEALDTYGYVLMQVGRVPDAETQFRNALSIVRSNSTRASVLLHLTRCLLEQNKKEEARVQMDAVRKLMEKDPAIESQNRTEFDELNRRLGSP